MRMKLLQCQIIALYQIADPLRIGIDNTPRGIGRAVFPVGSPGQITLSRLAVPVLAGIVLDRLGYPAMFTVLALCMVVVVGVALLGSKVLQESISKRGEVR